MARDDFERHIEEMPEPKLELLDGRFSVGNGAGNMQLLRHILEGWGAAAALPMAPTELWWQALSEGFRPFHPPAPHKSAEVWHSWAAQLSYAPDLAPAGPMIDVEHSAIREALMMGLFRLGNFAQVFGRDVVMRLGDDGLTPDVFLVGTARARTLYDRYLDGPADLVIEVMLRGHERYDREIKRARYGRGGVPEYWLVDPYQKGIEFLRWTGQEYRPQSLAPDGSYRPASFPGLSFRPDKLWEPEERRFASRAGFAVDAAMPEVSRGCAEGGTEWGDLEFDPRPDVAPRMLSFEEFASWAPRAKFECIDGKPWVGGSRGSRNALGFLLRTEGLARAVTVLHPREWLAALRQAEVDLSTDPARRERWWEVARQAALLLREEMGFGRFVVIGDLVRSAPLNVWSDITLVALDVPEGESVWDAGGLLYKRFRKVANIDLIDSKRATRSQQQAITAEGVEV